jgi:hypothetical protein
VARVATGGGLVALLLTLAATLGCSASGARTASPTAPGGVLSLAAPMGTDPASGPVCTEIVGLDNVTLTFDGGKTLVQGRHGAGKQASRLVSLGAPYTLAALGGGELFISVDGGCHWTSRATTAALGIGEGQGGLAYGWSANDVFAITVDGARTLKVPAGLTHVEADPANKARLTALGWNGTVWSSTDGGDTWQKVGLVSELDQLVVAFAPGEFDHALLGDRRGDGPVRPVLRSRATSTSSRAGRSRGPSGQPSTDRPTAARPSSGSRRPSRRATAT